MLLTGTLTGCITITHSTGGDARKASRHTPAIDHDALRRRNLYRIHQISIYDTASHALGSNMPPLDGLLDSPTGSTGVEFYDSQNPQAYAWG